MNARIIEINGEWAALHAELDRQIAVLSSASGVQDVELLLSEYVSLKEHQKIAEKALENLKGQIKQAMDGKHVLQVGSYSAMLKECTTTGIDRAQLTLDFGSQFIIKYTKSTPYQQLLVQKLGG